MNLKAAGQVVAFGSDGTSVNLGVRGSVAALLKHDFPLLILCALCCPPVRVSSKQCYKTSCFYGRFTGHASKWTRWLPNISKALEVLTNIFTTIITHFNHVRASRAGPAEVQDILKVLGNFSPRFQEDNLTLSKLCDSITSAPLTLVELKHNNGGNLDAFISEIHNYKYKTIELKNVDLNKTYAQEKEEIVDAVNTAIDNIFNPMLNDPVIKASIAPLDIVSYSEARAELALYGNVELIL
ncbi:hypothetical protein KUTeg_021468 [Tegillarca granosa]|uniref:Uncharacterized protein n=1 Tax=Tegillarca granosa TaxID=220873 RepID=A0ABQ9E3P1_TEGGR|nr:hypothetical protein KUTeg_021468 [Tegillarca granosa]